MGPFRNKHDDTFSKNKDTFGEELMNEYKVEWPVTTKMNHTANDLGDNEQFTKEAFITWENKGEGDKYGPHYYHISRIYGPSTGDTSRD